MDHLLRNRKLRDSITPILKLYTQLLGHESLRPDLRTFELILSTMTLKEMENHRRMAQLEHRSREVRHFFLVNKEIRGEVCADGSDRTRRS